VSIASQEGSMKKGNESLQNQIIISPMLATRSEACI
jgi:hypothetical protein